MTESAWWAATDPDPLLDWLSQRVPTANRKRLLFAIACCRRVIPVVTDSRFQGWATVAELLTDEPVRVEMGSPVIGAKAFLELARAAIPDTDTWSVVGAFGNSHLGWFGVSEQARRAVFSSQHPTVRPACDVEESRAHCTLLHDIFGPLPFRDITVQPSWLTSDVLALARGIYDEKAFDRMPILADALQDAGCDNDDMLNHCRQEGWEHVRGCWLIDLLLARPWRESS